MKKVVIILFSIIILIGSFFAFKYMKDNKLEKDIKKHYNKYVKATNNISLYKKENNQFKEIGTISKDTVIELTDRDQKYFKLEKTDYYVNYLDVEPDLNYKDDAIFHNYIYDKKNIKTTDNFTLYDNDNIVLKLNESINLDLVYIDTDYYVNFNNKLLSLKESDKVDINLIEESKIDSTKYVSIIYFDMDDNTKYLDLLKENNYINISIKDYKLWNNDIINLPKKAVLVLDKNSISEFDYELSNNNNASIKGEKDIVSNYVVNNETTDNEFLSMLNHEFVSKKMTDKVSVINYHFFYDGDGGEICDESLCLDVKNFEEQLRYLKYNGYKTLTMEEFTKWMYGEIELPEKSVLLTVDDGAHGTDTHLPRLLEKYDLHATLFLITAWWPKEKYASPNLEIQSHGNDIHISGYCSGVARGAKGLCLSPDNLYKDLMTSISLVDNNLSFCFPFYAYNESAISTIKKAGFKVAFIGGNRKATRDDNKYKIPRYPVYKHTSLKQFIDMIN